MRRRIVLDTNCLLPSISRRSRYYPVWERFICGEYDLCVTTEILAEYDFDVLATIPFPHVKVVDLGTFIDSLA